MKFIDKGHEDFYYEKLEELKRYGKTDVYYRSLVYTLGICEVTRTHFKEIFDISKSELNIDSICYGWQTGTSVKVTRMAFNLWNHSIMYDSEEDLEEEEVSNNYSPSEIFCCGYAPYFWEAIKIRYPEYTEYTNYSSSRIEYLVEEKIEDKKDNNIAGLYIRTNEQKDISKNEPILNQIRELENYCKTNNINNRIHYIDIGKSGLDKERKALQQMISDIKENKINTVLVKDLARMFRNPIDADIFISEDYMKGVNIISLDQSIEKLRMMRENLTKVINDSIEEQEIEFENI